MSGIYKTTGRVRQEATRHYFTATYSKRGIDTMTGGDTKTPELSEKKVAEAVSLILQDTTLGKALLAVAFKARLQGRDPNRMSDYQSYKCEGEWLACVLCYRMKKGFKSLLTSTERLILWKYLKATGFYTGAALTFHEHWYLPTGYGFSEGDDPLKYLSDLPEDREVMWYFGMATSALAVYPSILDGALYFGWLTDKRSTIENGLKAR